MIDYETRVKLDEIKEKFENLKSLFNPLQVKKEIEKLEKEMTDPNFWNDPKKAEKVSRKAEHLKKELEEFENIEKLFEDIEVAFEFAEEDEEMKEQALEILKKIENTVKNFELDMLLSGPYVESNAFLTVHPGAGGTESHDWAEMLLRMYTRWAEKNGYKVETIDFQPGEVAGVKNATIKIIGNYAYGKLKYESGVHRLVRISPFDAANRRHTSFASVSVVPEIDEEIEIEIKPEELKIETFRASGHGGQHVNKTESAVRITHLPTGIVVTCQNERSQHQNKATALKILKARLYEIEMQKKLQEKMKLLGDIKDISWGNQIRSYVLYPYTMVKDHRTGYETSKAQDVLDGEINDFIEAELLYFAKINKK